VQELGRSQARALRKVLPHGVLEPADDYFGMGIALRQPGQVRRLPLPYRDGRVAEIALNGNGADGHVEIINVHVQAPHSLRSWSAYRNRRGQLRGLERHLDARPEQRRVVVGDLNATPKWPWYRRVSERLVDAAVAAAEQNSHRPQATWGPWPGSPRLLRIDHALVHRLAVEDFRIMPIVGSDHSAIVVDLVLA
jgi:endonuclease/exonuclease/phosphatase family metal-dependent hydrolase